ncbi:MAG: GNAT family N-acetyltransferase [Acetobacteraceae bacterium]|nr:GNAT family N-acetyltransferase [Acetobacteraceae bacterium]MBV8523356.1 GNAT family N-acetyltransferase [Acetobacteraceae bacterium]
MTCTNEPADSLIFTETAEPDSETIRALKHGVDEFNFSAVGPDQYRQVWIIGRDNAGVLQAGLRSHITWSWLFLDWLWVASAYRSRGVGSEILLRTEAIARDRGCLGVYLNTFSYQAPLFYERHGYREFGRLEGMPPGHDRIWFSKRL